jgi:hypothetical protein
MHNYFRFNLKKKINFQTRFILAKSTTHRVDVSFYKLCKMPFPNFFCKHIENENRREGISTAKFVLPIPQLHFRWYFDEKIATFGWNRSRAGKNFNARKIRFHCKCTFKTFLFPNDLSFIMYIERFFQAFFKKGFFRRSFSESDFKFSKSATSIQCMYVNWYYFVVLNRFVISMFYVACQQRCRCNNLENCSKSQVQVHGSGDSSKNDHNTQKIASRGFVRKVASFYQLELLMLY